MVAVSNSSPLILYARVGRLDLLHKVFGDILIPDAVYAEVVGAGAGLPGSIETSSLAWIRLRSTASNPQQLPPQFRNLGAGETEAVLLAQALNLPLLIDDLDGRRAAEAMGIAVTGSAGVLLLAKESGHIAQVQPILDQLLAARLRLASSVVLRVLQLAGED